MEKFKVHNTESAPRGAKDILKEMQEQNGFVPNLYGVMANSPSVVKAYHQLGELFGQTSFTPVEQNLVWLAVSQANKCHYCMPIHTMVAKMFKVPDDVIDALRNNIPIESDPKLDALRRFTKIMVEKRGWPEEQEVKAFLEAGYSKEQILELIVGIAQKTISNYVNHIAQTPVDEAAKAYTWESVE